MSSVIIQVYGSPILRKKALKVSVFNEDLKKQAKSMLRILHVTKGIGLAAPQVGKLQQLVVIDFQNEKNNSRVTLDEKLLPAQLIQPLFLVNPTFEPLDDTKISAEEGCLSLPEIQGVVSRHLKILVDYQDLEGVSHKLVCDHWLARCVQHEWDHLQGILFIDRISKAERKENGVLLKELKTYGGTIQYDDES